LLVDDLEENLFALTALLRQEGLEILTARSGTEALELLLVHDVALAILDVQMPEMNGFELAEIMRGTERTRRVPIIFLTAGGLDDQRRFRGYDAGAVDFLFKPVEPYILRSKAEVFFELYRQRQEVARQREELRARAEENARLLEESRLTAAALREADRRKNEFLAMLAHELRNPLGPILNALAVLRARGTIDPLVQRQGEIVKRQVDHMARLVSDLLDVSRIAQGKLTLQRTPLDLVESVRGCAGDYRETLESVSIGLQVVLPDAPMLVHGDHVRLCQAVGNLLNNARKFTPGGGLVTVELRRDPQAEIERAAVTVRDTGAGIPAAMLPRIWESFVQGEQDLARTQGGLGLGLALVKVIVEMHGGAVSVTSPGPGLGSEFTLSLPLLATGAHPSLPTATTRPVLTARGRRVLLIEDNRDAAETMQELLECEGHEVCLAFSGPDGLEAARSWEPDLVLCDIGLPGMSGYQVAEALRRDPSTRGLRVVALSGYAQPEHIAQGDEAGFDDYLAKPVDPDELLRLLN
jgi:signal transduction histidine kinase